ncbi:MAG: DUF6602 domain-containing protein [Chitinophagales bacterium]
MANWIFIELLEEKINELKHSFNISDRIFRDENKNNKLFHSSEFGSYREESCKEFLSFFVPKTYGIDSGFIITPNNEVSSQCDIIIYDKSNTPLIKSSGLQKFFPIETVVAVGEVKSTVNSVKELDRYLEKLSKMKEYRKSLLYPTYVKKEKKMSESLGKEMKDKFNPNINPRDQITTFLICKNFNFDCNDLESKINEKNIVAEDKHNMVLSLEDGLLAYECESEFLKQYDKMYGVEGLPQKAIIPYPIKGINKFDSIYFSSDNTNKHIQAFVSYLYMQICHTTVLFPDIMHYIGVLPDKEVCQNLKPLFE